VAIDDACAAYGDWPSRRFGLWDDGQPGGGPVALAFDFTVRLEALEARQKAMKRDVAGVGPADVKGPAEGLRGVLEGLPADSPLGGRIREVLKRGD
jgi:hypothetical protein